MNIHTHKIKAGKLALAVEGALIAMLALPMVAYAEDSATADEAAALKRPTNFVEFGITNVNVGNKDSSAKFGEYNGLNKSDPYGIGSFDVRGGNAYEGGEGTIRWQVKGVDLGTTSREIGAGISSQGQWDVGVSFDQLRHHLTDGYQTPYQGNMGANAFTLPSGFGTASNTTSLSATQQAAFHTVDVYTNRDNSSITAGFRFDPQWDLKFDFKHLNQTGARLTGFGSMNSGASSGENISILPNPTNWTTDTINLALNWAGDQAHLTAAYYGSLFRNEDDRFTVETYRAGNSIQTMSVAPGNQFHQLNLSGGYTLTEKTKLAGSFSYGRATQNDPFVYDSFMMTTASPTSSFNGLVVNTHGDLKLTDQSFSNLTLTAGFKYDEHDNQSPSNIYNFHSIDGGHDANYPNRPLSYNKIQAELAGDYRLTSTQHIRLAYNREDVSRWCNNYAVNAGYPAGTQCVVATDSADDKVGVSYKLNPTEDVHMNASYSYSARHTQSLYTARTPFIEVIGVNGVAGQNGGDFGGFYPFFDASRKQHMVKGGIDWQANDRLSLNANGRYTFDDYGSQYGFQKGNTWSLNFDASYKYSENGSATAYVTKEFRGRDMTNLLTPTAITATATRLNVPAGGTWTNKLKDDDITVGLGVKHGGLMGGKLELAGDMTFSLGQTAYSTLYNFSGADLSGRTCDNSFYLTCGKLPDITNRMYEVKLNGDYKINKDSKVALGYRYQNLTNIDYYYNGLQSGYTATTLMPTNQQPGSYSVNVFTAAYIYTF